MLGKNEGTSTYREDFKDFSGLKMRNVRCHQFDILNINAVDRARGIFDKTVSRFRNTSHRECMEWWYYSSASNHFFLSTLYDHLSSLEDFDIVNVRRTILLRRTQLFYQVVFFLHDHRCASPRCATIITLDNNLPYKLQRWTWGSCSELSVRILHVTGFVTLLIEVKIWNPFLRALDKNILFKRKKNYTYLMVQPMVCWWDHCCHWVHSNLKYLVFDQTDCIF